MQLRSRHQCTYTGAEYILNNFICIYKATFSVLYSQLKSYIQKTIAKYHMAVSVYKQTAVTISCLTTNIEYWTISPLFGIGSLTLCTVVCDTAYAFTQHLLRLYVQMPSQERLRKIIFEFDTLWSFPQVAGAIDGTQISILKPTECH